MDVTCKLANCEECVISGISDGCDRCADGFYFDQAKIECVENSVCQPEHCAKCEADPYVCE